MFTIFLFMQNKGKNETRVKLIIITYLNKIVVSHTSILIMVYMNVLQFDVYSNCLPIERFMRCNISRLLIASEIQFSQLLFNCLLSGFPMLLHMPHGKCLIHACCSGVLSLHLSHQH